MLLHKAGIVEFILCKLFTINIDFLEFFVESECTAFTIYDNVHLWNATIHLRYCTETRYICANLVHLFNFTIIVMQFNRMISVDHIKGYCFISQRNGCSENEFMENSPRKLLFFECSLLEIIYAVLLYVSQNESGFVPCCIELQFV